MHTPLYSVKTKLVTTKIHCYTMSIIAQLETVHQIPRDDLQQNVQVDI